MPAWMSDETPLPGEAWGMLFTVNIVFVAIFSVEALFKVTYSSTVLRALSARNKLFALYS